jgi:cytochrome c oxidase cbb3-type subunit IV
MSALWGNAIGVMIVIIMLVFIGIWIWAWRSRHKVTFDRLSALPMEDSPEPAQEYSDKNIEQPHHDDKGSCS